MAIQGPRDAVSESSAPLDWVAGYVDTALADQVAAKTAGLINFRRQVHRHPELAFAEHRTTQLISSRLELAGLRPRILPTGTGLICDIPSARDESHQADEPSIILLRADIDALPIQEETDHEFKSEIEGVSHACGHDVHTSIVLGAGLLLAELSERFVLPSPVRLVFQPAEEIGAGGLEVIKAGALEGVRRSFALHCDPSLDVGLIGLKTGPVTGSCDFVDLEVRLRSSGTEEASHSDSAADRNVLEAWGAIVTALSARLAQHRPDASVPSLVWGQVVGNAPEIGERSANSVISRGTVRCRDGETWDSAPSLVEELIQTHAKSNDVEAMVTYHRGSPPTINDEEAIEAFRHAAIRALGATAVTNTQQSLGGEDFAWYLRETPGALVRLGVRTVGDPVRRDLHQGDLVIDEDCIALGVRLLVAAALLT